MNVLQQNCEKVEIYSVDEAFLEFDDSINWAHEGERLRHLIFQCTGIPTSIGFGPTKTLAKLANIQSKSLGIACYIDNTPDYHHALKAIQVSKIWGIGINLNKSLKQQGIYSAYDLMMTDPCWARKNYSIVVERIVRELSGFSCMPLTLIQESKKSIQITRSFSAPIQDKNILKQAAARYGFRLALKLRESSRKTNTLFVYGRNSPYQNKATIFHQRTIVWPEPTNETTVIIEKAQLAIEDFFDENVAYHKIGIMALDLWDATSPVSKALFEAPKPFKKADIDKVMDTLNKRFGLGTVRPLSCGEGVEWMNKRNHKTPVHTTNWKTLVQVKAK
jgi:DNA polymerase V